MTRIMLHICCAPCATHSIEALKSEGEVIGIFANPNIQPQEEYFTRLEEARGIASRMGIRLIELPYDSEGWNAAVRGLEDEPEGGLRCDACFRVRFEESARVAAREGCDALTSTLTTGPQKKAEVIHRIGQEVAAAHGLAFRKDNFKKKGGYQRSVELSREFGLYRQNYCGCLFSRRGR